MALPCVKAILAVTIWMAIARCASASYALITNYEPGSDVVPHSKIDLDQKELLSHIKTDYTKAYNIYALGANSGAKATFTVPALTAALAKGAAVTQAGSSGTGKVKSNAKVGATSVQVSYTSTCKVGGTSTQVTSGCFTATGALTVGGSAGPAPTAVSNSYRTIKGFSTGAPSKMAGQVVYEAYKKLYGKGTYADDFVNAAFEGTGDFQGKADVFRQECAKKGAPFMNVWMYVIREMEDAIDDCNADCATCNDDAVHAWDEAVAFYSGSLEGTDGSGSGNLLYYLADKRCQNFKTCGGTASGSTAGSSNVNARIIPLFAQGKTALLAKKCSAVRPLLNQIVSLMSIPLIQGSLRYAYKVAKLQGSDKEKGEGVAFSHAILGRISACDTAKAKLINDNMGVASTGFMAAGFPAIKTAFESTYKCMGVTCADIGGLWNAAATGGGAYYAEAEPCKSATAAQPASASGAAAAAPPLAALALALAAAVAL